MATIRDVARESGVSVATVSYVLNNGPRPVKAATRQRVLDVMRRLDYHPNAMARGLVRRRMYTLGVLFGLVESSVVTNPYAAGVLEGVFAAAADRGYNILLFPKPWEDAARSAAPFRDRRADGVLLIAPLDDSDMASGMAALGLPLIIVSAPGASLGVTSVDVDNVAGGRIAGEYLLSLGHRRIAHISGEERYSSVPARRLGLKQALESAGLSLDPAYDRIANYNYELGYEATRELLALPQPPTALFAGNDMIALAALQAARDEGRRVPEDFSIIGFDDIALARLSTPPLTTIRQPLAEMGAEATHLLIDRIEQSSDSPESPTPARTFLREPVLVVRDTTGPAPNDTMGS